MSFKSPGNNLPPRYIEEKEIEFYHTVEVELQKTKLDVDVEVKLDRSDVLETFKGIETIYWDADNIRDKGLMELFADLVEKHGTAKMYVWLDLIKQRYGA